MKYGSRFSTRYFDDLYEEIKDRVEESKLVKKIDFMTIIEQEKN